MKIAIPSETADALEATRKERGEKYCDCEAHIAATQLLAKFGRIEL